MNINKRTFCRRGFSLTEMLIATGIMAIGLVLVATIFPVGVKLTTMSTERSIAAVAADEAFAKVQLYGVRDTGLWPPVPLQTACTDFMYLADVDLNNDGVYDISDALNTAWTGFQSCYYYPSDPTADDRKYCWSALCRQVSGDDIQVTVFVSRKMASGMSYYGFQFVSGSGYSTATDYEWPTPVRIDAVYNQPGYNEPKVLYLVDNGYFTEDQALSMLGEGYTIVNNHDGRIYQIEEISDDDGDTVRDIILRQDWKWDFYDQGNSAVEDQPVQFWVVPPAIGSSRYPCIGVYQKIIRFD